MDKRLINVSVLGLGFMFVLTSFLTVSNVQVNIVSFLVLINIIYRQLFKKLVYNSIIKSSRYTSYPLNFIYRRHQNSSGKKRRNLNWKFKKKTDNNLHNRFYFINHSFHFEDCCKHRLVKSQNNTIFDTYLI